MEGWGVDEFIVLNISWDGKVKNWWVDVYVKLDLVIFG